MKRQRNNLVISMGGGQRIAEARSLAARLRQKAKDSGHPSFSAWARAVPLKAAEEELAQQEKVGGQ